MQLLSLIEHLALLILVFTFSYLLWLRYQEWQEQSKKKDKKKPKHRKWRPQIPDQLSGLSGGPPTRHKANPATGEALAGVQESTRAQEKDQDPGARLPQSTLPLLRYHR